MTRCGFIPRRIPIAELIVRTAEDHRFEQEGCAGTEAMIEAEKHRRHLGAVAFPQSDAAALVVLEPQAPRLHVIHGHWLMTVQNPITRHAHTPSSAFPSL